MQNAAGCSMLDVTDFLWNEERIMLLLICFVFAGILLLVANGIHAGTIPRMWIIILAILGFFPLLLACFLPPVALLGLFLAALMVVAKPLDLLPRTFGLLSLAGCIAVFALCSWFSWNAYAKLVARVPYVSMENRLPRSGEAAGPLSAGTGDRLAQFEQTLDSTRDYHDGYRSQVKDLHENAVDHFINQDGFGIVRRARMWPRVVPSKPTPQPGQRCLPPDENEKSSPEPGPPFATEENLGTLFSNHKENMADFANPDDYGYVKDRRHVAGFRPHHFRHHPKSPTPLAMQTLDLVGLIVHPEPIVYVSDYLPRMDELVAIPTRTLNDFESQGLASLRKGEDLAIREAGSRVYVLGAIRSAQQCIACHGGERGNLLGAFSYTFKREETPRR